MLHLRRAVASDADVAAEIYLLSRAAAGPQMPPGMHSDDEVRAWVADVMIAKRETWLADLGSVPAGLLVLNGDDLDWLFVAPIAQGQGVGSALLDHAKSLRPDGLALWVFESNVSAQRFYELRGFVAIRRTDGAANEERAPDVRYAWGTHAEASNRTDV